MRTMKKTIPVVVEFERSLREMITDLIRDGLDAVLSERNAEFGLVTNPAPQNSRQKGLGHFISVKEAASRVGVSSTTIRRWGKVGLEIYGPRSDRVDPEELDEFVRNHRRNSRQFSSHEDEANQIINRRRARKVG